MKGAAVLALMIAACVAPDDLAKEAIRLTGGDPVEGRRLAEQKGCPACHVIDGIPGARGAVGPSLNGMRERPLVAGILPHDVAAIVSFLQDPHAADSATMMPDLGLLEIEARHITSFLYTLPP